MQPVRGSSEGIEWRWKLHLNLWLERSRPRRALTKKASRQNFHRFPLLTSRARDRHFRWRIQDGRAAILAAAPVNFLEGTRLFFPCRKAGAPGSARFFVRTSASASALNLLCVRTVITNSVFLA